MSIIKSFSVGNGDMSYIDHNSDNFTIIDCNLTNDDDYIIEEIKGLIENKGVNRFISTHPDEDHILGLKKLYENINIYNFYCVDNNATKDDESDDFKYYCTLRDNEKTFYVEKSCKRKWMNISDKDRGSAGINFLWPILDNEDFLDALDEANDGGSPNNISPIFKYSLQNGATVMWMGDIETDFLDKVKDDIDFDKVNILFAPHHGRKSGKVPADVLSKLDPDIVVIGEAPSGNLNYYSSYNTITQNSAGEITFECLENKVNIYVSKSNYSVDYLTTEKAHRYDLGNYIGTLNLWGLYYEY